MISLIPSLSQYRTGGRLKKPCFLVSRNNRYMRVYVYASERECVCVCVCIFTSTRVLIANAVVVLFGLSSFSSAWATQGVQWTFDVRTNRTRLDIWVSDNRPNANLLSLQYVYLGSTQAFFYVLMTFVTVYLSAERCICIIRVLIANAVVVLFGISCFSSAWATQGVQWTFDVGTNRTRLDIWVSDNRRDVELFNDACNGMALPVLAEIMILVCTGFMLQGIRDSTMFRQRNAKKETSQKSLNCRKDVCPAEIKANIIKRTTIMSSKDLKLTKIVVLLAMLFFVCNLPVFVSSFLRTLIPEIRVYGRQNKLHALLYSLVLEFGVINCTANILVYYNASSRYRHEFKILFNRFGFTRDHNLH
ncbi:unnamed protein product [Candidula unifasciata]|uniref:G-protein coupled receptors family 1 profile domain-containing protein n=1 Tax=Candidula unifasciata TaxID=100452 RepID=A0A8S4A7A9_9EUPU|nr:unnamed protein product [Candidula unifasciata]